MEVVGKVVATSKRPATVNEFTFWVAEGGEELVEVGHIIVAERDRQKIFGLVTEIKYFTDAESAFADYYSHEFGQPHAEPPTIRQEVHLATAEVIGSDPRAIRPTKGGLVRLAEADEVQKAYGMDEIRDPILCGVIPNGDDPERMAPALISRRFLLGPEGAHANFSGASGLATKTSAAVSLIQSVLSAERRGSTRVAVLAFNVKSEDLLWLEANSDSPLLDAIHATADAKKRRMLEIYDEAGVDLTFENVDISYFAPGKAYNPDDPNSLRPSEEGVKAFYYSLSEVKDIEVPISLRDAIEPSDLDDKSVGVISTIEDKLDEWGREVATFRELLDKLPAGQGTWQGHHGATVAKVRRLLRTNLKERLAGLFTWDQERGEQIPVEKLQSGEFWIVDIQSINDKGKRLVFANILERVARLLEVERVKERTGQDRLDAVVVFVDELNKFAPTRGKGTARLRDKIVEIAARGRSIGLVLLGAEQFASQVDKEVIGNVSTHFVGRTEQLELSSKPYRWISRDLQYLVSTLPKGKLLLRHALFNRPVFIEFPQPVYTYTEREAEEEVEKANEAARGEVAEKEERDEFDRLRRSLKGKSGLHPNKIWSEVPKLREIGVSQSSFSGWFRTWMGKSDYSDGSSKEREALRIVLEEYS